MCRIPDHISFQCYCSWSICKPVKHLEKFNSRHWACGYSVFTRETFIADHMPPTKFANEMNNKWWRKWFKWEVSQRLWAQCRNCYSIQGGAVRSNTHVPVYHSNIRIHHFAPAVAYGLLQMDVVRHWVDKGVNPILDGMEFVERETAAFHGQVDTAQKTLDSMTRRHKTWGFF
eukprot:gene31150-38493_t